MYKDRETWREKNSSKIWRLESRRSGGSLSDRVEKRENGLIVREKNRPPVYLEHVQKPRELERVAVSAWK